jgi:hypothetical protein
MNDKKREPPPKPPASEPDRRKSDLDQSRIVERKIDSNTIRDTLPPPKPRDRGKKE